MKLRLIILCAVALSMVGDGATTKKGLAFNHFVIDDVDLVGASWYYVYGVSSGLLSDPRYVPMLVEGLPDGLPADYNDYVLVFNEPDNPGTGGHYHSPLEASQRWKDLLALYTSANLVCCGTITFDVDWIEEFLSYLEPHEYPEIWHEHGYVYGMNGVNELMETFTDLHDYVDAPIWITETGTPYADTQALEAMMLWMEETPWIERYAVFPNRYYGDEPWMPSHWSTDMALVEDGELTAMGETYSRLEVYNVYIPLIRR